MCKPIYTCRVTQIEGFRFWIHNQNENNESYINEENVIGSIMGIEHENIKAKFGQAGHSIIENSPLYAVEGGYKVDEFTFTDHQAQPMLRFRNDHPLMTRELALSKLYHTPHFDLIITGTCDHMEGSVMRDTKFKFSSFDVSDFMDSFQYRCYLDMAGMDRFFYDFFCVSGFQTIEDCAKARISECESMPLRRHIGMKEEVQSVINEFAEFVAFKDLQQYLVITAAKRKRIARGDSKLLKLI